MPLIAIPNVSEGRDERTISTFTSVIQSCGARVLDTHSDPVHHRSVLTVTGHEAHIVSAMAELAAAACSAIDLTRHQGVHPRVGALDVCPIVPHDLSIQRALAAAHQVGRAIFERTGLPIYFYGAAAARQATRELPAIRRGGLEGLMKRAATDLPPDLGPRTIDPRRGVVCVGARDVLIAFNVWLRCSHEVAKSMAASLRASGAEGVRALGLPMRQPSLAQISLNLTQPDRTGIDDAFELVAKRARDMGAEIAASEIVGLVPERHLPDPKGDAARLLVKSGRSLESALEAWSC